MLESYILTIFLDTYCWINLYVFLPLRSRTSHNQLCLQTVIKNFQITYDFFKQSTIHYNSSYIFLQFYKCYFFEIQTFYQYQMVTVIIRISGLRPLIRWICIWNACKIENDISRYCQYLCVQTVSLQFSFLQIQFLPKISKFQKVWQSLTKFDKVWQTLTNFDKVD